MSGQITVTSTTDTQEAVAAAAAHGGAEVIQPEPEVENAENPSEADEAETDAESETARNREEQDEEDEEEEHSAEEHPEDKAVGKTRRKLLRQVSRLNGRNIALQERVERLEEELRQRNGGKPAPANAAPAGKPDPRDPRFKNYEEYVEALADWKLEEKEKAKAAAQQQEHAKEIIDDYHQQVEAAREKYDDFDEVVGSDAPLPVIAINAMYEMENGAEVAYYLAKHSAVREQLLEWNQPNTRGGIRKIISKLDQISEQLSGSSSNANSNGSSKERSTRTSAPAPIRPVGGGGSSTRTTVNPSEMSFQDYKKWYAKQHGGSTR